MSRKSCLGWGLGIGATVVIAASALAILAFITLGWRPDFTPHIRPFRTEKASVSGVSGIADGIAVTPDGKTLATVTWQDKYTKIPGTEHYNATYTSTVSLWRIGDWQPLHTAVYHDIPHIYFTPDGQSLVVVNERGIEWKSVPGGTVTRKLVADILCCRVAVSPDWNLIATTGSNANSDVQLDVRLLSLDDGRVIRTIHGGPGDDDVAFSPDGQLLATAGFGSADSKSYSVRLWRVSDGTEVRTLVSDAVGRGFWEGTMEFSPDGQILAWTDWDSNVRLWRVSDGALLHTLEFASMLDVAFSPDGKLIAAGSNYDWGKLWRVSDGSLVAHLANEKDNYGSGGKLLDIKFSPDGKIIYGGTDEGTVRMWRVP